MTSLSDFLLISELSDIIPLSCKKKQFLIHKPVIQYQDIHPATHVGKPSLIMSATHFGVNTHRERGMVLK
ncbi:hypothetical protein L204_104161 [Cryptococcus depauperatus]